MSGTSSTSGPRTLTTASNLANLLPTGTVLAFQGLVPSFANNGECTVANKVLTLSFTGACLVACFLSSFTDSFKNEEDGKLYYGYATKGGLRILNGGGNDALVEGKKKDGRYKRKLIDWVHAFVSSIVFLVFAFNSLDVQECFFPNPGPDGRQLIKNLPLGAAVLGSILFVLFPTTRRGIGYADLTPPADSNEETQKSTDDSNRNKEETGSNKKKDENV